MLKKMITLTVISGSLLLSGCDPCLDAQRASNELDDLYAKMSEARYKKISLEEVCKSMKASAADFRGYAERADDWSAMLLSGRNICRDTTMPQMICPESAREAQVFAEAAEKGRILAEELDKFCAGYKKSKTPLVEFEKLATSASNSIKRFYSVIGLRSDVQLDIIPVACKVEDNETIPLPQGTPHHGSTFGKSADKPGQDELLKLDDLRQENVIKSGDGG